MDNDYSRTQFEDITTNYKKVKIALLNEKGDVISVSKEIDISNPNKFAYLMGSIDYDVESGIIDISVYHSTFGYMIAAIILLIGIAFSIAIEVLVACIFKLKSKQIKTIVFVNLISQIAMRLLYLFIPLPYWIATIILEICVYSAEFFVYIKLLKNVTIKKILLYTIIANTLSLLFGLFIFQLIY